MKIKILILIIGFFSFSSCINGTQNKNVDSKKTTKEPTKQTTKQDDPSFNETISWLIKKFHFNRNLITKSGVGCYYYKVSSYANYSEKKFYIKEDETLVIGDNDNKGYFLIEIPLYDINIESIRTEPDRQEENSVWFEQDFIDLKFSTTDSRKSIVTKWYKEGSNEPYTTYRDSYHILFPKSYTSNYHDFEERIVKAFKHAVELSGGKKDIF